MSPLAARRGALVLGAIVLVVVATRGLVAFRAFLGPDTGGSADAPLTAPVARRDSTDTKALQIADSLRGRSGALRFVALTVGEAVSLPGFLETFGEEAIHQAAARVITQGTDTFALITMRPFADKRGDFVGSYRLGEWPAERWLMARNYFNPDGFVEVTPENATLPLSRHFVLGDFVTHDQLATWPKYIVLEEKLIDKLELILQELAARGYRADRAVVLSGFRAPYYNERGMGEGMARASRHQYGDAADVIVDANGDGRMDDLNRDGRSDLRDITPITAAIEQIERKYPAFVGGLGTYAAMGPRGPFAHVDVRGTSARWEAERARR